MSKGKAFGIPQSVSPWSLVTRLDLLAAANVEPPNTWDAFIEVCTKLQKPPRLTGYGLCLGLATDADHNIMQTIWGYGGKLVEADNTTVALHSQGTIQAVQLIADMYHKHKIIPKGAVAWDNSGNNKAYQSRQALFVLNPTSLYASLVASDHELATVTGLLPMPETAPVRWRHSPLRHGSSSSPTPILRSRKGLSHTGWPRRTCVW